MGKKNNITKEQIEEYYVRGLHTAQQCADYFGVARATFNRYLRNYGIRRSKEDKSKIYSQTQKSEEVKNKIRNTNIVRYGAANKTAADSPIRLIDAERFTVCGKEYTVDWLKTQYLTQNRSSEEMCESLGITYAVFHRILSYYGVFKDPELRYDVIRRKTEDKYGVVSTLQLQNVKEKAVRTCLEKYGVDNVMKSEEIKEKVKSTARNRYGVDNCNQKEMRHLDVWGEVDAMKDFLASLPQKPSACELKDFFNLSYKTVVYEKIHDWGLEDLVSLNPPRSCYEDEIIDLLEYLGVKNIVKNDRSVLNGKEIDIYLPDDKIGIEFNGDYWHSDIFYADHGGRSTQAQEKSLNAEKKGVFLFTIFEREWNDPRIRKSIQDRLSSILILNKEKIPARKCVLVELSSKERSEFLNQNHIQGNSGANLGYGLKYNGELVACMTFSHPKNNKYT